MCFVLTWQILANVKKITLHQYLSYLEAAFLVHIVKRADQKAGRFQRENFFKILGIYV
jgi:predicted AAA+ superfamily ATPase